MSLDVYLYEITNELPPTQCLECIISVDNEDSGHHHESLVFSHNVTHNLGKMADAAGIYEACWRPEELMDAALAAQIKELEDKYFADQGPKTRHFYDEAQGLRDKLPRTRARDISELLHKGLELMRQEPERFRKLEPENKWGTYSGFVKWVAEYLAACMANPDAVIRVSR